MCGSGTRCMSFSHRRYRVPFQSDPWGDWELSETPAFRGADSGRVLQGTPPEVWVGVQELFSGHRSGCPARGRGYPEPF